MSAPTNHWKLGLFVVVGMLMALGAAIFLGTLSLNDEKVTFVSYFDESVTGLEVGSPARFRGVTVGNVAGINVAPDRRHVEVVYDMDISVLGRLGLAQGQGANRTLPIPPGLRAQLASMGVTGVKYVLIDFFEPESNPVPQLPFRTPKNTIPAASSMLKNIEDSVMRALAQFPQIAKDMSNVMSRIDRILIDVDEKKLPTKIQDTLVEVDKTLVLFQDKLGQVEVQEISQDTRAAIANLNATLSGVQSVMRRIESERGVLASMERASNSVGDVASEAHDLGPELSATMRDVREAADAIRQLANTLELDSDMLLKGRAKGEEP